jgi:hypothetical protein
VTVVCIFVKQCPFLDFALRSIFNEVAFGARHGQLQQRNFSKNFAQLLVQQVKVNKF